ncbi:MAG: helix-turn-helix domain-containing protein [Lachnospiraceae bacterium]|jgi:transcriptional regulator with XRE-family HTH domain|nr:helix-turn-helix domain-containing protein [Lachnospiraceae bacterium]MCI9253689.1 helix-turn-helix domain-containing protein [Lachnospiraceae bacterium]
MGTKPTKARDNVFCKARLEAAKYNDKLRSRSGAAEALGYASESTISDWELGLSIPAPEVVLKMSDLYNAPELENYYCTSMCPLGCNMPKVDLEALDRISLRALSTFRKVEETREILLDITADGVIAEDEKADLQKVLCNLEELEQIAQSMKLWVKKNMQEDPS